MPFKIVIVGDAAYNGINDPIKLNTTPIKFVTSCVVIAFHLAFEAAFPPPRKPRG